MGLRGALGLRGSLGLRDDVGLREPSGASLFVLLAKRVEVSSPIRLFLGDVTLEGCVREPHLDWSDEDEDDDDEDEDDEASSGFAGLVSGMAGMERTTTASGLEAGLGL